MPPPGRLLDHPLDGRHHDRRDAAVAGGRRRRAASRLEACRQRRAHRVRGEAVARAGARCEREVAPAASGDDVAPDPVPARPQGGPGSRVLGLNVT